MLPLRNATLTASSRTDADNPQDPYLPAVDPTETFSGALDAYIDKRTVRVINAAGVQRVEEVIIDVPGHLDIATGDRVSLHRPQGDATYRVTATEEVLADTFGPAILRLIVEED